MKGNKHNISQSGWFPGKRRLRYDLLSGFIVSLIALPLCLGIASASSFPPIAGILTSILGGLIVGFISGSELSIKGPAAGLIVIIAGAVEEFGRGNIQEGYILTTSLVALTGLAQIVLGAFKIGKWADFIPSSIIHGMLAAIGIIIISKQIHLLIGITPAALKGKDPLALIEEIPKSFGHLEGHISIIGILSLALLYFLPKIKNPLIKAIPPFLIVIVFSIIFAQFFHLSNQRYKFYNPLIDPGKLSFNFFFSPGIFSAANIGITIKYFFLLTIIGTIESLLTVKAVDLLDPHKRTSNYNKDVIAIGIGNLLAGLLGAMPMISEVARSSANINNKAYSRLSNIAHGAFLFLFVLIFVNLIKLIPVAALSSILIFVGLKLANPRDLIKAYKVSREHFIVFFATLVVTVCVDMLAGVATGIILKIIINFARSGETKKLFRPMIKIASSERQTIIILDTVAVFTNWLAIRKILVLEKDKKTVVDFSNVNLVDSSFIENITRYKELAQDKITLKGFQELAPVKNHPYSMRVRNTGEQMITIQLNPSYQKLKAFCGENNLIVSFSTVIPVNYFESFKSFRHTDLKHTKVYVTGNIAGLKFEYIEGEVYDSVDMLEFHLNIFSVDFGKQAVPRLMMQRESKLDTVIEFLIKNQVVFEKHPVFNSMYSVYSRDKEAVYDFFQEAAITYFEKNDLKDKIIEGDGKNKILICNDSQHSAAENLAQLLEIASVLIPQDQRPGVPPKEEAMHVK